MKLCLVALSLILNANAAQAASNFVDNTSLNDAQRYQRCLQLANSEPETAYEQALQWIDAGGGAGATHCSAVALIQLKHYPEAAFKLDNLARAANAGDAEMRAAILDQAGNAWLLAGQPENAEASFNAAIKVAGDTADLLADLSRAKGLRKDWVGAEADLDRAIAKDQYRADLLVLRASARHALGRRAGARADIDQALDLDPHYADALVERGAMKLEDGDKAGARADWLLVLATQPRSPAADSARLHIEALEVTPEKPPPSSPKKPRPTPPAHQNPSPGVHIVLPGG